MIDNEDFEPKLIKEARIVESVPHFTKLGRPFLDVSCRNIHSKMFIDTGAVVSTITPRIPDVLNPTWKYDIRGQGKEYWTVNGKIQSIGKIMLQIRILNMEEDEIVMLTFHASDNEMDNLMLGVDMMSKVKLAIK